MTRRHKLPSAKKKPVPDVRAIAKEKAREARRARADGEKQAELAAIVASSDDAIIGKTVDGIITSWNKGAERLYGYTAGEAIGQSISMLAPPELKKEVPDLLRKIAKGEHLKRFRTQRVRKDGRRILVSLLLSPIYDAEGNVTGTAGIARDVTDLWRQEEQSKFLLEAGKILSSSLDYRTTLTSVAEIIVSRLAEWCTIDMKMADGSVRQLVLAHKDPAMIDLARELQKKYPPDYDAPGGPGDILRTGRPVLIERITDEMLAAGSRDEEHLRIARSLQFTSYMGVPLVARGQILGALSLFAPPDQYYDESDLFFAQELATRAALAMDNARLYEQKEEALEEVDQMNAELEAKVRERTAELEQARQKDRSSLVRLQAMVRHLPMAALLMDESGHILELNETYCRMFRIGMAAEEAMRIDTSALLEKFRAALLEPDAHMEKVMRALREKKPVTDEILLKDGRIVVRDFIPIYEGADFRGQLFLYTDVTRERRADATKTEFMSLASHQLRTPLTMVRWCFGRLRKELSGALNDRQAALLGEGENATARMADTINTMLRISRIQSGATRPAIRQMDLCELLEEKRQNLRLEYEAKKQSFTVDCGCPFPLRTDETFLREILRNLLLNAIKYTPEGGSVTLRARCEEAAIVIEVQDSGYGIPKDQQKLVFQKFFRGDNVVSKDTSGTGLGLYLVWLMVDMLGGSITFVSKEGEGTTFTLKLPTYKVY